MLRGDSASAKAKLRRWYLALWTAKHFNTQSAGTSRLRPSRLRPVGLQLDRGGERAISPNLGRCYQYAQQCTSRSLPCSDWLDFWQPKGPRDVPLNIGGRDWTPIKHVWQKFLPAPPTSLLSGLYHTVIGVGKGLIQCNRLIANLRYDVWALPANSRPSQLKCLKRHVGGFVAFFAISWGMGMQERTKKGYPRGELDYIYPN